MSLLLRAHHIVQIVFSVFFAVLLFGIASSAHAADVTLGVSVSSVEIGQPIALSYSVATSSFRTNDRIIMVNEATGKTILTQTVGSAKSGTKTFSTKIPGKYVFKYKASITKSPIFGTSAPVQVKLPSASAYTLTLNATTLASGQPLVVTYAAPAYAHQSGDSIVILDAQNKQVSSQSLGSSPSGSKTFTLRTIGKYTVQYRLALTGKPVIKTAGPVSIVIPDASLFTVSPNITTAEIGQPITVSFSAPASGHQSSDDIVLFEQETGKIIKTVTVGSSLTGTKVFEISTPGTYGFAYRLNLAGNPLIAKSAPVRVVYVNTSRIDNYPLGSGPIIALGDSITFGRDATIGNDFVTLLSSRIGETIINAGVNGDTTAEALARLDTDVLSKNPRLVIVFLGGNDLLQRVNTNEIFNNIGTIVDQIQANGSAVLLLAYKDVFFINYDARFREIAWSRGAAYTPNVMGGILGNPFYTTDLIHPRNNGHKLLADRIEPYLEALID